MCTSYISSLVQDSNAKVLQSDDNKEQGPPKPYAKQRDKGTYHNPPSLPSTI